MLGAALRQMLRERLSSLTRYGFSRVPSSGASTTCESARLKKVEVA